MEGGNEANAVSGITQFAEGEPKRLNRSRTRMSRLAAVPCRKRILSRKERKERKVTKAAASRRTPKEGV